LAQQHATFYAVQEEHINLNDNLVGQWPPVLLFVVFAVSLNNISQELSDFLDPLTETKMKYRILNSTRQFFSILTLLLLPRKRWMLGPLS
jgi:hypothetical protein